MDKLNENAPITAGMKRLLIAAVAIGLAGTCILDDFFRGYALVWMVYILSFCVLHRDVIKAAPSKLMLVPFAFTLCVMTLLQAQGYSDSAMLGFNFIALPAVLLLHAAVTVHGLPRGEEAAYAGLAFKALAWLFTSIEHFFRAIGALFQKDGKTLRAWAGVLIALPVAGVALALLISADAVMGVYANRLFSLVSLSELLSRGLLFFAFAMLSYSFMHASRWKEHAYAHKARGRVSPVAPRIVVGALVLVYALFAAVQFVYLFGGHGLPEGLTYSEYAREGFWQLIFVAAINFTVYAVCLARVEENKALRALLLGLLLLTGVILASAFTRLSLYIGAYGLTLKRVLAFWLLCYLSLVLIMGVGRLYHAKVPLLRIAVIGFVAWYTVLNVVDLNALYRLSFS